MEDHHRCNAALSSFLAGDLDMVGLGTGELIKQATAAGATIQSYTDGSAFYIYFNNNDQYLSNVISVVHCSMQLTRRRN